MDRIPIDSFGQDLDSFARIDFSRASLPRQQRRTVTQLYRIDTPDLSQPQRSHFDQDFWIETIFSDYERPEDFPPFL
jgi:hypothetical protein